MARPEDAGRRGSCGGSWRVAWRAAAAALLLAGLGVADAVVAAELFLATDRPTYFVGDEIVVVVEGDAEGELANRVFGKLLITNPSLVDAEGVTPWRSNLSSNGGQLVWSVPAQTPADAPCASDSCVLFDHAWESPPRTVVGRAMSRLELRAAAPGWITFRLDESGGPDTLDFFGVTGPPTPARTATVAIVDIPPKLGPLAAGEILVVTDGASSDPAVLRVDPDTGRMSLLSGRGLGTGPSLYLANDVHVLGGDVYVAGKDIVRVDPETGDRRLVWSDFDDGTEPFIRRSAAFLDADAQGRLLVTTGTRTDDVDYPPSGLYQILRIDPGSGATEVVPGPSFQFPLGGIVSNGPGHALVASGRTIYRIDLATGDRTYTLEPRWIPFDLLVEPGGRIAFTGLHADDPLRPLETGIALERDGSVLRIRRDGGWKIVRSTPGGAEAVLAVLSGSGGSTGSIPRFAGMAVVPDRLVLEKAGPDAPGPVPFYRSPGAVLDYAITLEHRDWPAGPPEALENLEIRDDLPPLLDFEPDSVAATGATCTTEGRALRCDVAPLAPGSSAQVSYRARLGPLESMGDATSAPEFFGEPVVSVVDENILEPYVLVFCNRARLADPPREDRACLAVESHEVALGLEPLGRREISWNGAETRTVTFVLSMARHDGRYPGAPLPVEVALPAQLSVVDVNATPDPEALYQAGVLDLAPGPRRPCSATGPIIRCVAPPPDQLQLPGVPYPFAFFDLALTALPADGETVEIRYDFEEDWPVSYADDFVASIPVSDLRPAKRWASEAPFVGPGGTARFAIEVTNAAGSPRSDVRLLDLLPGHLTVVHRPDGCSLLQHPSGLRCPVVEGDARLAPGDPPVTFTVDARAADPLPPGTTFTNTLSLHADPGAGTASLDLPLADVRVEHRWLLPRPVVLPGESVLTELVAENRAGATVGPFVLVAEAPGALRITQVLSWTREELLAGDADCTLAVADDAAETLRCTVASLAAGASPARFTVRSQVTGIAGDGPVVSALHVDGRPDLRDEVALPVAALSLVREWLTPRPLLRPGGVARVRLGIAHGGGAPVPPLVLRDDRSGPELRLRLAPTGCRQLPDGGLACRSPALSAETPEKSWVATYDVVATPPDGELARLGLRVPEVPTLAAALRLPVSDLDLRVRRSDANGPVASLPAEIGLTLEVEHRAGSPLAGGDGVVSATLPSELAFGASEVCTFDAGARSVRCPIAEDLAAGQSRSFELTARAETCPARGQRARVAAAIQRDGGGGSADVAASPPLERALPLAIAQLALELGSGPRPPPAGRLLNVGEVYDAVLAVRHVCGSDLPGVRVTGSLPAALALRKQPAECQATGSRAFSCDVPTVEPVHPSGPPVSFAYEVAGADAGLPACERAVLASAGDDVTAERCLGVHFGRADLVITKRLAGATADAATTLPVDVTVTHTGATGPIPVSSVTIVERPVRGLTLTDAPDDCPPHPSHPGAFTCNLDPLGPPGADGAPASATRRFTYQVNPGATGNLCAETTLRYRSGAEQSLVARQRQLCVQREVGGGGTSPLRLAAEIASPPCAGVGETVVAAVTVAPEGGSADDVRVTLVPGTNVEIATRPPSCTNAEVAGPGSCALGSLTGEHTVGLPIRITGAAGQEACFHVRARWTDPGTATPRDTDSDAVCLRAHDDANPMPEVEPTVCSAESDCPPCSFCTRKRSVPDCNLLEMLLGLCNVGPLIDAVDKCYAKPLTQGDGWTLDVP